jgi:hypothetical protein
MAAVHPPSVTRMLTDEYGISYDRRDIFTSALEDKPMEIFPWRCGSNRTLHVGDTIFLLEGPYHWWPELEQDGTEYFPERGLVARGHLVAEQAAYQLRLLDSTAFGDLSATYTDGIWEELPEASDPIF